MHRHQVQRVILVARLMLAGFQRSVGEKCSQTVVLVFMYEQRGGVDQFVKVLYPLFRFALFSAGFVLIMRDQPALLAHGR